MLMVKPPSPKRATPGDWDILAWPQGCWQPKPIDRQLPEIKIPDFDP